MERRTTGMTPIAFDEKGIDIFATEVLRELGTMYRVHMRDARKYFNIVKNPPAKQVGF